MTIRVKKSTGWSGQSISTKKTGLGGRIFTKRTILDGSDAKWVLDPRLSVYDSGGLVTSISNPGTLGGTWTPWESNTTYSPSYSASSINGRPGLVFGQDYTSDVDMISLGKTSLASISKTFYFVYDRGTTSNASGVSANTLVSMAGNNSFIQRDATYFGSTPPDIYWGYSGGYPDVIQPAGTSTPEILVLHSRISGNNWFVRINGSTIYDGNGNNGPIFSASDFCVGNDRSSFSRSNQFVGTICWGEFREGQTDSQVIARESVIKSYFGI